jgi:Predicted membrane protein
MRRPYISARVKLGLALGVSSLASVGLYLMGAWSNHDYAFSYLPWNLMLAWTSLLITLWLERTIHHNLWSSWYALAVTGLWLVLLPNTFYMISDFVHIQEVGRVDLLYDVVMFSSFIFNGLFLGLVSLYIVHWELTKRVTARTAGTFIGVIILLCSFAIYIGRELRWNTWDILTNPSSVLFDVSDRVLNPREHPQAFTTTASFFVLLATTYGVMWYMAKVARNHRES